VKRTALASLLLILVAVFVLSLAVPSPTAAQGPAPTPVPATPVPEASAAPSPDEVLAAANKASNDAEQAVNMVNTLLSFIQVVGVLGGILAALSATAFAAAGIRTITDYRTQLAQARAELEAMRDQLKAETEEVRSQGDRAIRALALMQLGEQLLETKNTRAALRIYQEAYDLDPSNRAINYFLGELNIQQTNVSQGIEHLEQALAGGAEYAPAEAALAYALELQGNEVEDIDERNRFYARAESGFLKALRIDPAVLDINGESVYAVLGGLYKRQGRVEDAIRSYEKAEQITPARSYPIINLAMLHFEKGEPEEAERYFRRSAALSAQALEGTPADFWTRFDLTTAQLVLGRTEEAQKTLEVAIQQLQNPHPLEILLGDFYRLKQSPHPPANVDQMIETLRQAIDRLKP
jgi:tetratricopeptide (TPR) repeat protein